MWRLLALPVVLMALPATALAQSSGDVSVTLTPNVAAKPARLAVTASGEAVGSGQEVPKSLSVLIVRGLKADPRSRAIRCSSEQASAFSCPADSRVGTGLAQGEVSFPPFGTFPFTASVEAFLAPRAQAGDIAGVVVQARESSTGRQATLRGRLLRVPSGPFGVELRFENFDLGAGAAPQGASAKLTRFELSVEAQRTVRRVRVVRRRVKTRHGTVVKRRRVVRRRRFNLITNPPTCGGTWPYQLRASFPSSPDVVRDGSVACTRRRP